MAFLQILQAASREELDYQGIQPTRRHGHNTVHEHGRTPLWEDHQADHLHHHHQAHRAGEAAAEGTRDFHGHQQHQADHHQEASDHRADQEDSDHQEGHHQAAVAAAAEAVGDDG